MNKYQFTIVLADATPKTEGLEDRIYEAGCGDAFIHFIDQTVYLKFCRKANSLEEATNRTAEDINHAGFRISSIQNDF